MISFDDQFNYNRKYYLKHMDFPTWYRYLIIIEEVMLHDIGSVLEIGVGSKVVENILKNEVNKYVTMDINSDLDPDIVSDLREFDSSLSEKFECIICADVLEHMPFVDLKDNLSNILNYLVKNGKALIAIPHRRYELMLISRFPGYKTYFNCVPTWTTPRGFYNAFIKKKRCLDPHHCWEIGDSKVRRRDVENVIKAVGFRVEKFKKLPYVDFWILKRP